MEKKQDEYIIVKLTPGTVINSYMRIEIRTDTLLRLTPECELFKDIDDLWHESMSIKQMTKQERTLLQICKMIASGDIPNDVYDKYLSHEPIGFMTHREIMSYLSNEGDD